LVKIKDVRPVRNVISNWGGFLFTAIVSFFLGPFILARLGTTSYGVWTLIASLVGYLGLFDLGVRSAVTKFIASHHSAGDHDRAGAMKSAALLVFAAAGVLAVAVAVGISIFADRVFTIPPELEGTARIVIIIGGANIAVALITGVYGGILAARHRFDLLNLINVGVVIARSAAVVAALQLNRGLIALALIQLLSSVGQLLLTRMLSHQIYREAVTSVRNAFCRKNLRTLFSFGLMSSSIHVLGATAHNSGPILIGILLPVALVTYYGIAESLASYARMLMSGISQPLTPLVGAMEGAQQLDGVGRILIDGTRYAALIVLPIVATFIVRGESFISLWMGAEYGKLAGQVLTLLSIGLWAMAGYQICTGVMMGLGRHGGMVPIFAFEAIACIALSIPLIKEFGVVGAAWGALIPRLFAAVVWSVLYAKRVLLISLGAYYLDAVVRPVIAIVPFAAGSYVVETTWPASNLAIFFGQVALLLPVSVLGTWIFALRSEERMNLVRAVKRLRLG
jgi:O-antigen/teichoic acid export membrane protein